jgi:pyruvate formate lyase activating enzyme
MDYPIKGFLETSFSDWPGKMASVLFLPSCNFRCRYCHNHELVLRPEKYSNFPWEVILAGLQKRKGWVDGVCLTGGEPTFHPWLPRLIRDLRAAKDLTINGEPLSIKLDTNGSNPDVLQELIGEGLVNYVAMDLKAPLQADRYSAITGTSLGVEEMARIQASVQILLYGKVDYEFRTTVVPALLDEEEIYAMARRIRGAPHYNLQNFNPRETLDGSLRNLAPVEPELLKRMQKRVKEIIHPNVTSYPLRVTSLEIRVGTRDGATPPLRTPNLNNERIPL